MRSILNTSALKAATAGLCLALCAAPALAGKPEKSPSGLVYESLKEGVGVAPKATDTVRVHYRGTLQDGREFDSSYKRGVPAIFPLNRVIPCWTEGLQKMKPGGKARLTCPASIAYGTKGSGPLIGPSVTLNFEVELLAVKP